MLYLLNLFEQLIVEGVVIDNFVFRLHRKLTFIMLTVFAVAMASGIITTEPIEYSSKSYKTGFCCLNFVQNPCVSPSMLKAKCSCAAFT